MSNPPLLRAAMAGVEQIGRHLAPDSDWEPIMLMATPEGMVPVCLMPAAAGSELDRDELWFGVVPSILVQYKATEAVVVMTAWAAEPSDAGVRPAKNPERWEVLVVTHVTRETEVQHMAMIERSDGPPKLKWVDSYEELGGRVVTGIRRGLMES